jgi:hypothetical protein
MPTSFVPDPKPLRLAECLGLSESTFPELLSIALLAPMRDVALKGV